MGTKIIQKLESQWSKLKKQAQALHFKKGQILFYEGHLPYGIYLIESGKLVFRKDEKTCFKEHEFRIHKDRVIGLHTLLDNLSNECSCEAETECNLLFVSKTQLSHFLK